MANANLDTAAATVRAVCQPFAVIQPSKVDVICEIIQNPNVADDQIDRIREIVKDKNAGLEKPMSCEKAAQLLGISKAALHYHCRRGHIRRCSVAGAKRGRGVVAADVRAIVEGRASGEVSA